MHFYLRWKELQNKIQEELWQSFKLWQSLVITPIRSFNKGFPFYKIASVFFTIIYRENKLLMTIAAAFDLYILDQKIIGWGFQQPTRVRLPNGYDDFPCGYFTEYENGYKMIVSGASLGGTAVQEVMILDADGIPIARDSEDIRE